MAYKWCRLSNFFSLSCTGNIVENTWFLVLILYLATLLNSLIYSNSLCIWVFFPCATLCHLKTGRFISFFILLLMFFFFLPYCPVWYFGVVMERSDDSEILVWFLISVEKLSVFHHYAWRREVSSIKAFCIVLMYVLISWKAFNMYLFTASI